MLTIFEHPQYLTSLVSSISSPSIQTRKLAIDILTVICYIELPRGHGLVLKAFNGEFNAPDSSSINANHPIHHATLNISGMNGLLKPKGEKSFGKLVKSLMTVVESRGHFGGVVGSKREAETAGQKEFLDYLVKQKGRRSMKLFFSFFSLSLEY